MTDINSIQDKILSSINEVVQGSVKSLNIPKIYVGTVVQDPVGYKCIVNIYNSDKETILPEHLHDWISKDDIVLVQDTNGQGTNLVIIGSSGSTRAQTLVVHDNESKHNISGVTKIEDEDGVLIDKEIEIEEE